MLSQTTTKMTIALIATCTFFFNNAKAEELCAITSKNLAYFGNKIDEFFQISEVTANLVEAGRFIRRNKRVYSSEEFMSFATPLLEKNSTNIPVDAQSEISDLIWGVLQYDFPNNAVFLCDGKNFNSSSRKYEISSLEEHFLLNNIFIMFYMDKYYTK